MPKRSYEIGFIGGGNMAEAMIKGMLDAAYTVPSSVAVSEPLAARRSRLLRRYKVGTMSSNSELAAGSRIVVLAVKPQIVDTVVAELAGTLDRRTLVVSIAAGVGTSRLEKGLGVGVRVVRAMPNTPCLVGRGMSVLCAGRNSSAADLRKCRRLFDTVGKTRVVAHESSMHAVTALSGSGPAYVYLFAESLIAAGRAAGLDREVAEVLALETIAGAAEMMVSSGSPPAELRKAVSSPGGTTVAGLERLRREGLPAALRSAVKAAAARSRELARAPRR